MTNTQTKGQAKIANAIEQALLEMHAKAYDTLEIMNDSDHSGYADLNKAFCYITKAIRHC